MRRYAYSYPAPESEATRTSRKQRPSWTTLIIGAITCAGMLTSSAALGSHLTLPGSQDLHPSQSSDHDPLIRQLETINNYTSPHSQPNQDAATSPLLENSAAPSTPLDQPISNKPAPAPSKKSQATTTWQPGTSAVMGTNNYVEGHVNMGWKFLLSGRPQAAMAAYREALRHQPNSANAYVGMGITLKRLGDVEQAKQAIQHALELNPHLSSALVHLGYLYADGYVGPSNHKTARRLFDQASQLGDPFASIALLDLKSRSTSKF